MSIENLQGVKEKFTGKRILLLDDKMDKSSINKVQKVLNVKLTSSKELNSKVSAYEVLKADKGLHFEHLGVAVIDSPELATTACESLHPSILYSEAERFFYSQNKWEQLTKVKETSAILQAQLSELEKFIMENNPDAINDFMNATWGINAIQLKGKRFTGKGVNVAIVDTGFFRDHPDFVGRNIEGKSFIPREEWFLDGNGHGTHVAGTACGNMAVDTQIRYGVASESNMFIAKALSNSGRGSTASVLDAIDWALEKKCQVISMSLGSHVRVGENPSPIFERVGKKALENNCLIIAASGNESSRPNTPRPVNSPANAESILGIAAVDENLKVASFSNGGINVGTGGEINFAGPGVDVFSSYSPNARGGELYSRLRGTSMATPHVSGIAALFFEAFPNATAKEIWDKMNNSALVLDNQESRDVGKGLLQVGL